MGAKKVTALVLAGGNSTRMGQNKALLKIGSKSLIEIVVEKLQNLFDEIIVVTNSPENYPMLKNIRFEKDCIVTPVKNSLVGIYTGLLKSSNDHVFVVACDMPFLNMDLVQHMLSELGNEDVLVPFLEGHYEPLHAIYNKRCLYNIKHMIDIGNYKIINLYDDVKTIKVNEKKIRRLDPQLKSFMNINTKDIFGSLGK
ncbi:molybdenum cofactor guanylyltransferase [Alkaliphilus sp. B6464]|uniref:molybdenum cofactor guanylyltransferase n=1 Tax=Alkaliphilus sp. B6464 TaxID=2731219 RepID=UPI001BA623CB|nr:molybdenum cofactor guanylyltransferase [Alkaliphilus sp. B6464]QUH20634.1 molybdenum cofactor guanylyltransferase [Alkaliphilus sp. B6464]